MTTSPASAPVSANAASFFSLEHWLQADRLGEVVSALTLLFIGWLLARFFARIFIRSMHHRLTTHQLMVGRRVIYHSILGLFFVAALRELGFQLNVLLGAAGVLSVAIGFASQTSASNLISGLFLIGEGPFAVGDYVRIDATEGEVLSIDLLSVKLRTPDNLYVRIPNEQIIKTQVTNLTRFAIRRINLPVGIAYKENIQRVRTMLLKIAEDNPQCLDEPAPQVIMQNFGDSAINLMFYVWVRRENYVAVRDRLQESIKEVFDEAKIEIPFPQVSINASTDNTPLPLHVVSTASAIVSAPDKGDDVTEEKPAPLPPPASPD